MLVAYDRQALEKLGLHPPNFSLLKIDTFLQRFLKMEWMKEVVSEKIKLYNINKRIERLTYFNKNIKSLAYGIILKSKYFKNELSNI